MLFLLLIFQSIVFVGTDKVSEAFDQVLAEEFAVELPDALSGAKKTACHENGVVAGWCDVAQNENVDCTMLMDFDQYSCRCMEDASACPDECVEGSSLVEKTRYGIRCSRIPKDEPNYVLHENQPKALKNHCENNGLVHSWCDEYQNDHVQCFLHVSDNEYSCHCGGKHSACPDECIGVDSVLVAKLPGSIRCRSIPTDQPNYVIKETF